MPITKLLLGYFLTTVVFFVIDMVWLGLIAKGLYNKFLGSFLAEQVNWTAAIIFYLLFIVGIFIFAIMPALSKESFSHALLYGALFGFFTYATYDMTNLATLKDWPVQIVIIDVIWGAVLTASVSISGYSIMRWLQA